MISGHTTKREFLGGGTIRRLRGIVWAFGALLLIATGPLLAQDVSFEVLTRDNDFLSRNVATNTADLVIRGSVAGGALSDVELIVTSGNTTVSSQSISLAYSEAEVAGKNSAVASIDLTTTLPGSKDPYDLTVLGHSDDGTTILHTAKGVLIGDVYLLYGQSNAESRSYDGSANGNKHNDIRTFGNISPNPGEMQNDLTWYVADGDTYSKKGFIGQWPLRMARRLLDVSPVAISVINGAVGGKPISYFQRNDSKPQDLNTAYGRLLYRASRAGVAGTVRGIFWYQGENDGDSDAATPPNTYEARFRSLYEDLMRDYPAVEKMYVYQVRDGCGQPGVPLRDRMRQFEDKFSKVQAVSTTGINAHDGCHFKYTQGYEKIGDISFRLAARDFYGSSDTQNIDPPFIKSASFTNSNNSEITLRFRDTDDQLLWEPGSELYFDVEGSSAKVSAGRAEGSSIVLQLSGSAAGASGVTYKGHKFGGPWIANTRGVGALVFYNIPITISDGDADGVPDGGDNCPVDFNPDQADIDNDGLGNTCDTDIDGDGRPNESDNCAILFNPNQADTDGDGIGNACDNDFDNDGIDNTDDNCPADANPDQNDVDGDSLGDACDTDIDGDGRLNAEDNCASVFNPDQADSDGDGSGDVCDVDGDNDGIPNASDNCPVVPNPDQADTDSDGLGNACDTDIDGDGLSNTIDNCVYVSNPDQADGDGDGLGDACDADTDGDGYDDADDNCPAHPNPNQVDLDGDGLGDVCDVDADGDTVQDAFDNCPRVANPDQKDNDVDGVGDACDDDLDGDGLINLSDNCPTTANPDQVDTDFDGIGDSCDDDLDNDRVLNPDDNCPALANEDQANLDGDTLGDACDNDVDGDGIDNEGDNCPVVANPEQTDSDLDGTGDTCDDDVDGDAVLDSEDNCPVVANQDQSDVDSDGLGDLCDDDADADGLLNGSDNCVLVPNPDQIDTDGDGVGNQCEPDNDNDGIDDDVDNCFDVANPDQADLDKDGTGNLCDTDLDGDSVGNHEDNCPVIDNAEQGDVDEDGVGDSCDSDLDGDAIENSADNCVSAYNPAQLDADMNGKGNACEVVPTDLVLYQSFPNPARNSAVIQYAIPEVGGVFIGLFDSRGQLVMRVVDGTFEAGVHEVTVELQLLSAGTYFYTLVTGKSSTTRTMSVVP